jgi:hypothetical protein
MVGREHQGEIAAHAEADDTGAPGAIVSCDKPSAGRVQVAERLRPITNEGEETGPARAPVGQVRREGEEPSDASQAACLCRSRVTPVASWMTTTPGHGPLPYGAAR